MFCTGDVCNRSDINVTRLVTDSGRDTEETFKYWTPDTGQYTNSTMTMLLISLGLVLSSAAAATVAAPGKEAAPTAPAYEWRNINATFQDTTMLLNVAVGDGIIELHSHKPDNAKASFRETSNIHVFSRQLVAMRNTLDKECYVRHIIESFEDLKEKIAGIEQHDASKGKLYEDWIDVADVCPIESWAVEELLGDEIDCFCRFHKVYFVGLVHSGAEDPTTPSRRRKRAAAPPVDVASACACLQ
ncbi:uncharacterized protein LOC124259332 [Haliotis rubra]|uniref:uncharacterized protein LOC124259332 n=1 Tax=Haliotis rubra TaxID=36100 RepID=UPI001EE5B5FC|nr:uncharacterized protein LOC124259332 [Haliotis rubra]